METGINIIERPSLQYCTMSAFGGDALERNAILHKSSLIIDNVSLGFTNPDLRMSSVKASRSMNFICILKQPFTHSYLTDLKASSSPIRIYKKRTDGFNARADNSCDRWSRICRKPHSYLSSGRWTQGYHL